jgi:hypothetical protein
MTVQGRDASNFDDDPVDFSGLGFFTHKSTEGTTVVHDRYGARLAAARAAGVPVLGAYHVVRTPGSGGHGSLGAQLDYWFSYLDAHSSWWRSHPYFIMQVDAEKWPYDAVSAGTVRQFAELLVQSGVPCWKVTYASRGQYGDSLAGIATPLWNADYRGSSGGSYPGDGWTSSGGQRAGWADYSGQTPVLLQYTSTPYDKDAYRGTLDQLKTLVGGDMATIDDIAAKMGWVDPRVEGMAELKPPSTGAEQGKDLPFVIAIQEIRNNTRKAADATASLALTDADRRAIIDGVAAQLGGKLDTVNARLDQVLARLATAGHALES